MKQVTDPERGDYIKSILYIFVYLVVLVGGAVWLLPDYWYLWGLIIVAGLAILVNWHKQQTAYRCPNCGHIYTISFLTDLLSPHGIGQEGSWLLLRCPNCRQWKKTKVLKRVAK